MIRITANFTFPYCIEGAEATTFECRADGVVSPIVPANTSTWPGWPAEGGEVEEYSNIEVEVYLRRATEEERGKGKPCFIRGWRKPDEYLYGLIQEYLESGAVDDYFQEGLSDQKGDW